MNPVKQLASESTEFTEKNQPLNAASVGILHHIMRDSLPYCDPWGWLRYLW